MGWSAAGGSDTGDIIGSTYQLIATMGLPSSVSKGPILEADRDELP